MGNAFENTFSQVKEGGAKNVDITTSQQADIPEKIAPEKKTTKQHVDKTTKQHAVKLTREDFNSVELERKTIYLKPELAEMFKYIKFKKKLGESQVANIALENYFEQQFGKNWRALLK